MKLDIIPYLVIAVLAIVGMWPRLRLFYYMVTTPKPTAPADPDVQHGATLAPARFESDPTPVPDSDTELEIEFEDAWASLEDPDPDGDLPTNPRIEVP